MLPGNPALHQFVRRGPDQLRQHVGIENDHGLKRGGSRTKRAYESNDDAYRVFRKMLDSGHPPNDWNRLLAEARTEVERLQRFAGAVF
ncbi:type II toxin-antitoxin system YhaV family toxin [Rudaea sp.]|uniref:type II toxin-antitoxin system YhaV family toxin n=1 Tax=Rudaea sp. TaxID=2136325 RepID=UPI0039E4F5CB